MQLLAHVGYVNSVLGYPWINAVFWTLAIEFQYYIFIALAFPLFNSNRVAVRTISVTSIALLGILGSLSDALVDEHGHAALLPHWLPLFAMGIATFQRYVGHLRIGTFCILFLLISTISFIVVGTLETLTGVLAAATITLVGKRQVPNAFRPLAMAGTMSYSLYLLHVPVGGRIINLATQLPDSEIIRYTAIGLAFVATIACAYIFWHAVEKPSQLWAKSKNSGATSGR